MVLAERGRIRALVERKINSRIEWRRTNRQSLGFISHFEKLKDDILFLIDNPDHKPKDINWSKQKNKRPKERS